MLGVARRPGLSAGSLSREATVHTLQLLPSNPEHVLVCIRSSQAFVMTVQGQAVRCYSSGKTAGGDFLCATVSPQGDGTATRPPWPLVARVYKGLILSELADNMLLAPYSSVYSGTDI